MQIDLRKYLVCPLSQTELQFISSPEKLIQQEDQWQDGLLVAGTGWIYPVIGSIPRMSIESCVEYKEFILKNFPEHELFYRTVFKEKEALVSIALKKNYKTKKSFSFEWKNYDFEQGKTWGKEKSGILERFLLETGETIETLKGKVIFDAGAGNGHLDLILAEQNIFVIAMDFSSSVEKIALANKSNHLFLIEGDIQFPPIRSNSCDIIQCSGVLIHTNNTRKSFELLTRCVKSEGKYSVWLYRIRKNKIHSLLLFVRELMKPLPLSVKIWICRILFFPPSFLIKKMKNNKESVTEMMVSLIDFFTPEFRWEHDQEEVKSWFDKAGFTSMAITASDTFGYNITGTKKN